MRNNINLVFVIFSALKNILFEMSSWCNNYIDRVDTSVKVVTEDLLKTHAVFYSLCQALFYIISFRHQDLTDNKRSKIFVTVGQFWKICARFIFSS